MSTISAGTTSTTTLVHSGDTTGSLVFKTNDTGSGGTTAVTIDTSQNVGIGTSSPISIVQIGNGSAANKVLTINGGTGSGFGSGTVLQRNSVQKAIFSTDSLLGGNNDGASVWSSEAIRFYPSGTQAGMFDSSGNLLVGTTSPGSGNSARVLARQTSSGGYAVVADAVSNGGTYYLVGLQINGTTIVGQITSNGTTTTYATSSDYRLKENIEPMAGALAKVAQLKPVTYKWKSNGSDSQGFIAHELAEVVPECVVGDKDAVDAEGKPVYQGIDTSFLVATLTAALQETKALIDQQAETINALTARVVALESK